VPLLRESVVLLLALNLSLFIFALICRVYVDVVLNHMSGNHDNAVGVGGSTADTSNFDYPAVPFGSTDFNQPTCGIQNYADANNVSNENSDF
jgi:hypothetical protein